MGFLQKVEEKLEGTIGDGLARVFGGKVHPQEVAFALRRQAREATINYGNGRFLAPNTYTVIISDDDRSFISSGDNVTEKTGKLASDLEKFITGNGWELTGAVQIFVESTPSLRSGQFRARASDPRGGGLANEGHAPYDNSNLQVDTPSHEQNPDPNYAPNIYSRPPVNPGVPPEPAPHYQETDYTTVVPSHAPARAGLQVQLLVDDGSNRSYTLNEGSNIIGRGQNSDVRLPDTGVSRNHADIQVHGDRVILYDLNSTNGTLVNDNPITNWELVDGDRIKIGHSDIIVRFN